MFRFIILSRLIQQCCLNHSCSIVSCVTTLFDSFTLSLKHFNCSSSISFCHQVCAVVCTADKQRQLVWLLRVILRTLKRASQEGQLFAYVPSFYIDCLIEICSALCTYMHPTAPLENVEGTIFSLYICVRFMCILMCTHATVSRYV
jgi:hypothetical protein